MATAYECPAGESLLAYVQDNVDALADQGRLMSGDAPDAVHQMRISIRRLGTALSAYGKLLSKEDARELAVELKWLARKLGPVRDAEVMRQRLADLIAEQPPEVIVGPVAKRIDEALGAEFDIARRKAVKAVAGKRYARLLESFDSFLADPPLTSLAAISAMQVVPPLLEWEGHRLEKAVTKAIKTADGTLRDDALHEARKLARQLRYATEVAAPLHHDRAEQLLRAAKGLHKTLGNQHDSVVARARLHELSVEAHQRDESTETYQHLRTLELARAKESEARFLRAWAAFPTA